MSFFPCLDCGGSKASAVITDRSGTILGRALGGLPNFLYMSAAAFTDAVRVAVSDVLHPSPRHLSTLFLPNYLHPLGSEFLASILRLPKHQQHFLRSFGYPKVRD